MSLSDRMPIAGRLTLTLTDADGRVVEERRVKNLITLKGRAFLARSFAGLGATSVDMSMVLGTSAVAPALTDDVNAPPGAPGVSEGVDDARWALEAPILDAPSIVENSGAVPEIVVRLTATFPGSSGSAEHTLREAGIVLLTGPQGAERTLFNRAVFEPITKTERLSLTVGWELVF
ncbi:MAG: hypothetical protein IPO67_09740 [Deltaproteobacteria bacterium]|nr:hypothetical protein [Deltaproteobacteria bacterium]MBK9645413.1 hypothetical protein [Deltaproteobacteria bacterium]